VYMCFCEYVFLCRIVCVFVCLLKRVCLCVFITCRTASVDVSPVAALKAMYALSAGAFPVFLSCSFWFAAYFHFLPFLFDLCAKYMLKSMFVWVDLNTGASITLFKNPQQCSIFQDSVTHCNPNRSTLKKLAPHRNLCDFEIRSPNCNTGCHNLQHTATC